MWTVLQLLITAFGKLPQGWRYSEYVVWFVFGKTQTDIKTEKSHIVNLANRRFRVYNYGPVVPEFSSFKNIRARVDWAWINAEFSWCAGVEQIIFTPQDSNSSSFLHTQIVALCPLVDVCVQHVAFQSAWSAGFAVGRWLLPAQTALLTATGQQRGQKPSQEQKKPKKKQNITHICQSVL